MSKEKWVSLGLDPLDRWQAFNWNFHQSIFLFGSQVVCIDPLDKLHMLKDCSSPDEATALFLLIKVVSQK